MVYDSDRKVTILFGGISSNVCLNDTWEWDGAVWTQVADDGPATRYLHAMSYDSNRKRVVLFGGYFFPDVNHPEIFYTDTWEWDGAIWTQMADNGIRNLWPAMAYDSNAKKSILYSNFQGGTDTWGWDGSDWQKISDIGPSTTQKHDMCFNNVTNTILLYGGTNKNVLSETWEWDGAFWKQLSDFGPKPLVLHAMTFDGKNAILFGGEPNANGTALNETWQWNGKHWAQVQNIGPAARMSHAMCTDTARGRIVLFGGSPTENNIDQFNDTWEISTS
jgi:hypothetical protein